MIITTGNYHAPEANRQYMSNSQYKSWLDCAAKQAAIMRGEWKDEEREALLVGSYVDRALLTPDELPAFIERHKDAIQTKKGEPRAAFQIADKMIERVKRDDLFMGSLDGCHQAVVTWEMYGIQWRAMLDAVDPARGTLVDLKTVRDFEPQWNAELKIKLPFYESWAYWRQLAIYREGYKSAYGNYPAITAIAAVSKHEHPRLKVIVFEQDVGNSCDRFAHELEKIEANLPRIIEMRAAAVAGLPYDFPRCEQCDYCAETGEAKMELAESLVW
jgi:hypothetical protein